MNDSRQRQENDPERLSSNLSCRCQINKLEEGRPKSEDGRMELVLGGV